MYVILVYDIESDFEGQKIWRRTFKTCKKYLSHIQKSVFEGELTKSQIYELEIELKNNIRKKKDSVIVFKSRNRKWLEKEFWANEEDTSSNFI